MLENKDLLNFAEDIFERNLNMLLVTSTAKKVEFLLRAMKYISSLNKTIL